MTGGVRPPAGGGSEDEPPPILATWPRLYALVVAVLIAMIVLCFALSRIG